MSKVGKITISSLIAIVTAVLIIIPITSCTTTTPTYEKYFDLQFERGGRAAMPENTLYAFTYAIEQGATTIETQLQMTKDGVVVTSHSPLLNPDITMDKKGNYVTGNEDIRTMNYSEVEQYNVGHIKKGTEYFKEFGKTQYEVDAKIPTLEELFKLIQDSGNKEIMLNLETELYPDPALGALYQNNVDKNVFVNNILNLVKKYNMENRIIIQSFDWSVFPIVDEFNPNILTAALWEEVGGPELGVGNL
ncbi:MAG: glycerophosphodiester phosphodiesterase family protein [Coriobacteriia bacterium]|nr:glycerophosphodiester phosphodiesterase family protein [Coriobacteriia bacterium]